MADNDESNNGQNGKLTGKLKTIVAATADAIPAAAAAAVAVVDEENIGR